MDTNTNTTFDSIFDYQAAHPEKFEPVKGKKPILYFLVMGICLVLFVFPGCIPFCSGWLVRVVAGIVLLASAFMAWTSGGKSYRCIGSGEPLRQVGTKTFRDGKDRDYRRQILEAFARRDFQYLAAEPAVREPALTLGVYEDPGVPGFYLHIMYFSEEGFFGMTDVLEITGEEFTAQEQLIRSMFSK